MRLVTISAAAATVLAAATAKATLVLTLMSGASTVTITDNGAGDLSGATGVIISTVTVGDFSTSFTVGTSNSPGGATGLLQIQTLTVRNNAASTATLGLWLADTGFTLPGGPGSTLQLTSSIGGTLFGSTAGTDGMTFQSYGDPSNGNPFLSAYTPGSQVYVSTGAPQVSFNSTVSTLMPFTGPAYSMGNISSITLSALAQANVSGTTSTTVVPEPTAAALLVGATAAAARRRRS